MNFFPAIEKWFFPEFAIHEAFREMARDGHEGREGIAIWLGNRVDSNAKISRIVLLRGPGVIKQPDLLIIEPWLLNELTDVTIDLGVAIIGHIHSHGPYYGTDLSAPDRRYGIVVPYYLSMIAPDYALRENTPITDCGVHIFEPDVGYRRLPDKEIKKRIIIEQSNQLDVITIGR